MNQEVKDEFDLRRKLKILNFIDTFRNVYKELYGKPKNKLINTQKET